MVSRIASMFLVLLTIGFFAFHFWQKSEQAPPMVATIIPAPDSAEFIAHNEFLMIMDEGDEPRLAEVLDTFDLEVVTPLGEWVHVIKRESHQQQKLVPLNSASALENLLFSKKLEAHDAVHRVDLNYLQNADGVLGCSDFLENQAAPSNALITPSDPLFKFQWHLSKESGVDLPGAWSITTGSDTTVIALVDRNFDLNEDDLNKERCTSRKFFYENMLDYFPKHVAYQRAGNDNHGGQVLSVVAPCTDNSVGLAGVDWRAQVFAVDTKDNATFSARMFGLLWAAGVDVCTKSIAACPEHTQFQRNFHPANIINTSFGFAGTFLQNPPYGAVLDAISRINRQGRIIVASAGNEGNIADRRLPGAAGGVISVGSSNIHRQSSDFSNIGRTIDVVAPGEDIMGLKNGEPTSLNGTSFSTPIVTGIASLMLAVNPLLAWKHVEYILKHTATPMSCNDYCPSSFDNLSREACKKYCCSGEKNLCAVGIVNATAAVKMAQAGFPNHALVDVDDYFLPLSDDNKHAIKVIIKNWGKKAGVMRLRKTDPYLKMWPRSVQVAPIDTYGVPGTEIVTLFYDKKPTQELVLSALIEAADIDKPNEVVDRIEAIVSIVPDPKIPRRRLLREKLPKK